MIGITDEKPELYIAVKGRDNFSNTSLFQSEFLDCLKQWGFATSKLNKTISGIKNLVLYHKELEEKISLLDKACSALLIEVAFADKIFNESELVSLKDSLKETYNLQDDIINELIDDAEKTVEESTSLYEYTRVVNDEFTYTDKLELLSGLWKLALADGSLDKYEDHLIRKISDLIHISHSDFIRIKLESRDS